MLSQLRVLTAVPSTFLVRRDADWNWIVCPLLYDFKCLRMMFGDVNDRGCASTNNRLLFQVMPPSITQQPVSITVGEGSMALFTVVASGTPSPTFQWQLKVSGVFVDLVGETAATLLINAAFRSDNFNQYRAVITNEAGSVTSMIAVLTVDSPIFFSGSPSTLSFLDVSMSSTKTISISNNGTAPLSVSQSGSLSMGSWFSITSDLELESRIRTIDHLDRVHTTDRIESIDTIHRYSRSVDQRYHSTECEFHVELHCCSIDDIDTISIFDDLVWISVIVIDQDDIDLEQWRRIAERRSIRIALDGIMVLDLSRITPDLELESGIAFIDHLDRVHTTDRIESIDTIHRYSRSSDQRYHSAVCELHVELHCCSIDDVDTISVIDDLVWISVIDIDQDDIDLEQWCRIAERLSIRIALDGIMVLDLARITSDLELESRIAFIDHLDRVHTTDRVESIDTIHRYSRSVDQ